MIKRIKQHTLPNVKIIDVGDIVSEEYLNKHCLIYYHNGIKKWIDGKAKGHTYVVDGYDNRSRIVITQYYNSDLDMEMVQVSDTTDFVELPIDYFRDYERRR